MIALPLADEYVAGMLNYVRSCPLQDEYCKTGVTI